MRHNGDLFLAGRDARIGESGCVFLLSRASLNRNGRAARVRRLKILRIASSDAPCRSDVQVRHHVDLLLALGGNGERRDAHVELCAESGDDRGEFGVLRFSSIQTHDLGERLVNVNVIANGSLSIGIHVFGRCISGRSSVTQGAPLLNVIRNERCNLVDSRDR